MSKNPNSVKELQWINIVFFTITTLGCVVGAPLYLYHYGISWQEIALFAFYMIATGTGITVGYHRLFSHVNYKAHPIVQFWLLFFGAAAFEQTAYRWSSQHRDHHRYVDTDMDPYSIKKGFWYAHIGWLVAYKHKINYENSKDLAKNKLVMHQHNNYILWAVGSGIILPILIGALTGHALGAFIFAVCARITLVYHCTFFINSICHMFGKATYDIYATAKDHWFIAFLTYGEGYHNFHHRFPSDYRNGVRWYQWDPSKWSILILEKLGLVSKICRVSRFSILSARLAAENQRACDGMAKQNVNQHAEKAIETMRLRYEAIRSRLAQWEVAARDYRELVATEMTHRSEELVQAALAKLEEAKAQFKQTHENWRSLVAKDPIDLQHLLLGVAV